MSSNAIETVMGAVVLTVAGGFLYFAYENSNVKPVNGYSVTAAFTNVSGIAPGSSVRIGGIKVGVIEEMELDPTTYQAITRLRIEDDVKLPKDSSAAIQSTGLIGEKFLALEPGGEEENLKDGDKIAFTQPSVSLEEMIGKFVFSGGGADKDTGEKQGGASVANEPAQDAKSVALPSLE